MAANAAALPVTSLVSHPARRAQRARELREAMRRHPSHQADQHHDEPEQLAVVLPFRRR